MTSVFLGPQILFSWSEHFSAQVAVDLPISLNNSALQTVPNYRVRAALTYAF